jgi:hypothetical protein
MRMIIRIDPHLDADRPAAHEAARIVNVESAEDL